MATFTRNAGVVFLAHQAATHPVTLVGADQDASSAIGLEIVCFHALVEAVANTNPGSFLVQGSPSTSGDDDWATQAQFTPLITTPDSELLSGVEAIGSTVLDVASTVGFAAGQLLYIQDAGVLTDSEWRLCESVNAGVSVDIVDGLTNAKDASDTIWNDAEVFTFRLTTNVLPRYRVIFQHEGAVAANAHVKATGTIITDIS